MSSYTTQLRYLVEKNFNLGLDSYPIFDESYRERLNKKIVEHYYFREIGLETAGLFARFMARKMNEIMPYYNQLYKSELIKIEPLTRVDLWETLDRVETDVLDATRNDTGKFTGDMEHNSNDLSITSDTPQGMLNTSQIEGDTWASSATKDKFSEDTNTEQNTTNVSTTNQNRDNDLHHTKHTAGNDARRTDMEMLKEYRSTFLNIDMQVIEELEPLFMQIW